MVNIRHEVLEVGLSQDLAVSARESEQPPAESAEQSPESTPFNEYVIIIDDSNSAPPPRPVTEKHPVYEWPQSTAAY